MARTFAPGDMPADKAFTPRHATDTAGKAADAEVLKKAELKGDILAATNQQKLEHFHAKGQQAANDLGASVLVHFHRIPGHEYTPPTMDAVLVPAKEEAAAPSARATPKAPTPPQPAPVEHHARVAARPQSRGR